MREGAKARKEDIVRALAAAQGLRRIEAQRVVQGTLDAIVDAVLACGRLELRDFGVFEVRVRKGRRGRHLLTGEPVEIPTARVVVFRPGCNFRGWVRGRGASESSAGAEDTVSPRETP